MAGGDRHRSTTQAQIVYSEMLIQPGQLAYTNVGVGIANLTAGATAATRNGLVFTGSDFRFGSSGGFLDKDGTTLYLYDCWIRATFDYPCHLARVSVLTAAGAVDWSRTSDRANYRAAVRAADGTVTWSTDLSQANEVVQGSTTGWSVAWNPGLSKYVAFESVPLSNQIVLRTADQPAGPWSDPLTVVDGQTPNCPAGTALCIDYAVQQHAELAVNGTGTSTVYLTYARPNSSAATPFRGDLDVVRVNLQLG